ncbi:hypothetical protein LTR37_008988 [Vermiconidia calcicola]|uniref:Uncharacterized protein n=1 Tax=Vermiconidia calcicola TaxID=1690605 RepID=A0ACC3N9P6_9PEZI|nr:hypothetical protein LTR37_008988 [Vermiconidia calcicola]
MKGKDSVRGGLAAEDGDLAQIAARAARDTKHTGNAAIPPLRCFFPERKIHVEKRDCMICHIYHLPVTPTPLPSHHPIPMPKRLQRHLRPSSQMRKSRDCCAGKSRVEGNGREEGLTWKTKEGKSGTVRAGPRKAGLKMMSSGRRTGRGRSYAHLRATPGMEQAAIINPLSKACLQDFGTQFSHTFASSRQTNGFPVHGVSDGNGESISDDEAVEQTSSSAKTTPEQVKLKHSPPRRRRRSRSNIFTLDGCSFHDYTWQLEATTAPTEPPSTASTALMVKLCADIRTDVGCTQTQV